MTEIDWWMYACNVAPMNQLRETVQATGWTKSPACTPSAEKSRRDVANHQQGGAIISVHERNAPTL
jgi:hypothetical protein